MKFQRFVESQMLNWRRWISTASSSWAPLVDVRSSWRQWMSCSNLSWTWRSFCGDQEMQKVDARVQQWRWIRLMHHVFRWKLWNSGSWHPQNYWKQPGSFRRLKHNSLKCKALFIVWPRTSNRGCWHRPAHRPWSFWSLLSFGPSMPSGMGSGQRGAYQSLKAAAFRFYKSPKAEIADPIDDHQFYVPESPNTCSRISSYLLWKSVHQSLDQSI